MDEETAYLSFHAAAKAFVDCCQANPERSYALEAGNGTYWMRDNDDVCLGDANQWRIVDTTEEE